MGQFFTPVSIARFMAEKSEVSRQRIRLLDPGAGIGILSAAWVARACEMRTRPRSVHLTAYEADPKLVPYLEQTLKCCADACHDAGIEFHGETIEADFIETAVESLADRALFDSTHAEPFDCAILNPPYRKLNGQSSTRRRLRSVGIETSNLYAAFLWLTFRLLEPGGELIAITPRSFCNGLYFRPFREAFLREMALTRLHVFESRTAAFKDCEVLQENIIFRAVKDKTRHSAIISSSVAPDDPDTYAREVLPDELVNPRDSEQVIHIVADEIGTRFAQRVEGLATTLDSLGIQVSTGRVVDFRARHALAFEPNGRTVPLIYPLHFDGGFIAWPKPGKKPNYLIVGIDTENLLVPAGVYVLVKRFSAKEEKRRVTAAVCDPSRLPGSDVGFENHLNYFHRQGNGLPLAIAKGLAAYLNSTLIDTYFRQISGHTQVNASDLRSLNYPDQATLERLGHRIGDLFPNQAELDAIIREELSMVGDDPVKVGKRVTEAREILFALGLPSAQQNERSALTLLALLDLSPDKKWKSASSPLLGVTPIMDWFAEHYGKRYAPNTRETVRRQTLHQFIDAGIVVQNPDDLARPINSGLNVYQIKKGTLKLLRSYGSKQWNRNLKTWLGSVDTLKARYARERDMNRIPLSLESGETIELSPGGQNVLVQKIIE